ncbi:antibiotic biosynthesis monooxygenase family protein [Atopobium sp. oral taxon 416]|jgi:quinol monooxygenase YgiN|uniref:antibiotic biosynthesis monooxygenase family protein n=1 Tax=Atopobium sp. oral taxon 416 TaxID=712157 RepID=UPI001BABF5E6|nr:antibiotic biosynthesis monooxygenase [Atopobium sp. oral taxon 416]QUC02248.1 antibiotic biosynthesis monooxygenase [Atopobium sp. oral taxon 416]
MSLTINIYYTGSNGSARAFAKEMEQSGIANDIRNERGNESYNYFLSMRNPDTVLLIDQWKDQKALDEHHNSPMMEKIAELRDKYDLHMQVKRYVTVKDNERDATYIRK